MLFIIIGSCFLMMKLDNYYENKKIKRWSNTCKFVRDSYREEYGYSPPGWEWEIK